MNYSELLEATKLLGDRFVVRVDGQVKVFVVAAGLDFQPDSLVVFERHVLVDAEAELQHEGGLHEVVDGHSNSKTECSLAWLELVEHHDHIFRSCS